MNDEVRIIWEYFSPRGQQWLEWFENGRTHMRIVTDEFYQSILTRVASIAKPTVEVEADLDFLS